MIKCTNIKKSFGKGDTKTEVLHGVNLEIKEGEFVAIMGPSGSGKSTLMNILGLLDIPTFGTYELNGKDISNLSDNELADIRRKKIGFVFQTFNLLPRTTVLRNVALPLIYLGIEKNKRKEMSKKVLKMAGLDESFLYNKSNELSGGQMQRVAIARALVNNPNIIFADEPTGNLDSKTGKVVLETFQKLNDEYNRTIILITHERYIAEHADRIIHVLDGNVVEDVAHERKRLIKETKNSNKDYK